MEQWQSLYASIMACYCQVSYDYQDALANQSLLRDMLSRLDGQQ